MLASARMTPITAGPATAQPATISGTCHPGIPLDFRADRKHHLLLRRLIHLYK